MIQKQMTLAALAALFIIGNAGIASAEGGISSAASDEGSSAAMEADAATHGNILTSPVPFTGARAHASAGHQRTVHKVSPERENGTMNQHG